MGPGAVAHFTDGQKTHTGVVLDVSEDGDAWALFLTSNPRWNKRCRPLTADELALCGFSKKDDVQTYFAPVIRPANDAYPSDISFPDHRVLDLSNEFGPSPFLPPAISLPPDIYPPVKRKKSEFTTAPLSRFFDQAIAKHGGVHDWEHSDGQRLGRVAWGLDDLPRSELQRVCAMLPGVPGFFTRRPSISLSLQTRWAKTGSVLEEYREKRGVPGPLMARRIGITDREYRGFENGLLCPAWGEMLAIQAMLPGIPDEWTLPTSVPLLADCILIQMRQRRWYTDNVSSKLRMPLKRVNDILISSKKPTDAEMVKLRTLFQTLPPWRPLYAELDGLCPLTEAGDPPA